MLILEIRLFWLVSAHILILSLSNTLVQYPFALFGFHTTWGAFSYPLIFILTDLSTRLLGQTSAKRIILQAMFPGLACSYLISNYLSYGSLLVMNSLALRIALASFCAYVSGQWLDIAIFQKLRQKPQWWVAPSVSSVFGNLFDTYLFFSIAFYGSSNVFLGTHWPEMAIVDLLFKLTVSLISFVPLYGVVLQYILQAQAKRYKELGVNSLSQ